MMLYADIQKENRIIHSLLLALGISFPWLVGIYFNQGQIGGMTSFGTFLIILAFPKVPKINRLKILLKGGAILFFFGSLGALVDLGSIYFFVFAILCALLQGLGEIKGGYLRSPLGLASMAYFLSIQHDPAPISTKLTTVCFFCLGVLWGIFIGYWLFLRDCNIAKTNPINLKDKNNQRFSLALTFVSFFGCLAAYLIPTPHSCWLPISALRVMKPSRKEAIYRMKARGTGSLFGAFFVDFFLYSCSSTIIHAISVGIIAFFMLIVGAKKYGYWTFFLTAIALTYDFSSQSNVINLSFDRVFLTLGGISLALLSLPILLKSKTSSN